MIIIPLCDGNCNGLLPPVTAPDARRMEDDITFLFFKDGERSRA